MPATVDTTYDQLAPVHMGIRQAKPTASSVTNILPILNTFAGSMREREDMPLTSNMVNQEESAPKETAHKTKLRPAMFFSAKAKTMQATMDPT